jgi:hypothetical protein
MLTKIAKKSVKAGKRVNTKHVDSLIKNYKRERWVQNSKNLGKEDSLSVWYSLEELMSFMQTAKENGSDGIRLYFGVYDKDTAHDTAFEGRQTIVLVATKQKEVEDGVAHKEVYINTENGNSILAFNAGWICPPKCGSIDDGDGGSIGITILDKGDDGFCIV